MNTIPLQTDAHSPLSKIVEQLRFRGQDSEINVNSVFLRVVSKKDSSSREPVQTIIVEKKNLWTRLLKWFQPRQYSLRNIFPVLSTMISSVVQDGSVIGPHKDAKDAIQAYFFLRNKSRYENDNLADMLSKDIPDRCLLKTMWSKLASAICADPNKELSKESIRKIVLQRTEDILALGELVRINFEQNNVPSDEVEKIEKACVNEVLKTPGSLRANVEKAFNHMKQLQEKKTILDALEKACNNRVGIEEDLQNRITALEVSLKQTSFIENDETTLASYQEQLGGIQKSLHELDLQKPLQDILPILHEHSKELEIQDAALLSVEQRGDVEPQSLQDPIERPKTDAEEQSVMVVSISPKSPIVLEANFDERFQESLRQFDGWYSELQNWIPQMKLIQHLEIVELIEQFMLKRPIEARSDIDSIMKACSVECITLKRRVESLWNQECVRLRTNMSQDSIDGTNSSPVPEIMTEEQYKAVLAKRYDKIKAAICKKYPRDPNNKALSRTRYFVRYASLLIARELMEKGPVEMKNVFSMVKLSKKLDANLKQSHTFYIETKDKYMSSMPQESEQFISSLEKIERDFEQATDDDLSAFKTFTNAIKVLRKEELSQAKKK